MIQSQWCGDMYVIDTKDAVLWYTLPFLLLYIEFYLMEDMETGELYIVYHKYSTFIFFQRYFCLIFKTFVCIRYVYNQYKMLCSC